MTTKWIGAAFILISCGGFGLGIAAGYRRRERLLRQLLMVLETLESELQYHLTPLPELARKAALDSSGVLKDVFLNLTRELAVDTAAAGELTLHSAQWRSEGTVDQLYIALRLAVAEELTPGAPLVLDDALVRFDNKRLNNALKVLTGMAESCQVILFTCQSREKELYRQ